MYTKYLFLHEAKNKHNILKSNGVNFCFQIQSTENCVIPSTYITIITCKF